TDLVPVNAQFELTDRDLTKNTSLLGGLVILGQATASNIAAGIDDASRDDKRTHAVRGHPRHARLTETGFAGQLHTLLLLR
ncbi:MAG: hypothetical protein ABSG43_19495, partial [Solirubrobacteraceae bacterium]